MIRLSRDQVRRVDQICIDEYGLPGIVLMENAARSAAQTILVAFPSSGDQSIAIVCGAGNNGGDGYAIARHLYNAGVHVDLVELDRPPTADAAVNRTVATRMRIPATSMNDIESLAGGIDVWIDAIFGTGISRPPTSPHQQAIEVMNASGRPIVAIDLPSGLDCDTGEPLGDVCVRATRTVTFVAEKLGFANPRAREFTGTVTVGDIGCPRAVIDRVARR